MSALQQNLDRIRLVGERLLTGFTIAEPVGDWSRGARNREEDVRTVQLLLETAARVLKVPDYDPRGVDGRISRDSQKSNTVIALRAWQRGFMNRPDGLAEPGGRTMERLRRAASGAKPEAGRSVMKAPGHGDGKPGWLFGFNPGGVVADTLALLPGALAGQPAWVSVAEQELGVTEDGTEGRHNARIVEYHKATSMGQRQIRKGRTITDETPWCASFVSWVMTRAGYASASTSSASAWKKWGVEAGKPVIGAVAVIDWGLHKPAWKGKGHVGFVVGRTSNGRIVLLGGNQSNAVNYTAVAKKHIVAYRVPADHVIPPAHLELPVMKVSGGAMTMAGSR